MELFDALELLSEDSLLAGAPDSVGSVIRETAVIRRVAAGQSLCRQGSPADRLVIPINLTLRLSFVAPDGSTQNVGQLGRRRSLNLGAVLRGRDWEYSAESETEGFVLEVAAEAYRQAIAGESEYARYLTLVTERRSVREVLRALRSGGAKPTTIQRFLVALEEREFTADEILSQPRAAEAAWVLVDQGLCGITVERGGERLDLGALEVGDYYGGSTILLRMRAVELKAVGAGRAFFLSQENLRAIAQDDPTLRQSIGREKPELIKKVRKALIEVGAEFTQALTVGTSSEHVSESASGSLAPLGEPWAPPVAISRRAEGPRCAIEDDSGASAAATLLKYHGISLVLSEVKRRLRRHQPSLLDIGYVLERAGLSAHAAKVRKLSMVKRLDLPLITVVDRRYVVLFELDGRWAKVFDPLSGLRRIPARELEKRWKGSVLMVRDVRGFLSSALAEKPGGKDGEAPVNRRASAWAARWRFMRMIADSRGVLISTGLIGLAVLLLGLASPRLSGVIVDQVLVHHDYSLLVVISIGLLLINAFSFILSAAREIGVAFLTALLDYRLSTLIYRHTLGVEVGSHGSDRVGATLSRMQELQRVRSSLSADLVDLVLQIAQGLVYLVMVFWYSWKLGLLAVAAGPLAFIALRIGGNRFRGLYTKAFDQLKRSQSETTEQIESIATIKAVSGEQQARGRWEKTMVEGVDLQRAMLHTSTTVQTALVVLQECVRYAGLYLAVRMAFNGEITPGTVLALTQYLSGAVKPLFIVANKLDELEQLGISFEKLDELLRLPLEAEEEAGGAREPDLEGNITVRDVSFAYDPDAPQILSNISFDIKRGQTIAVVGRSGSGKTTLAKLLQGAMRPSRGEILYDDLDSASLPLNTIRRNVGVVMQESHLFAGSIRDNIAYGDDRPDDDRVRAAARLAAAHEFIVRFPAGYNTYLAEGGLGLSGGQRQRISLARALYRDPRILILDEATSALDAESERAIMSNMREILRNRTAVVIAHRLHTVKNADVILVIDQGSVVEVGRHAELIANRGLYHALFAQQFNQA